MEDIEDKIDFIISVDQKRHKELLAAIGDAKTQPSIKTELAEIVSVNSKMFDKIKELTVENNSSAIAELAIMISENNKLLGQLIEKMPTHQKKEFTLDVKRNKFSGLIESVSAIEK